MASITTPLQLIAISGLSDTGNAFFVLDTVTVPAEKYLNLPVILNLANVLVGLPAANVPSSYGNTLAQLTATNCPAITDSIPSTYAVPIEAAWGNNWTPQSGFMGGIVLDLADRELGRGDTAVFGQIFGGAVGYMQSTNNYINSAKNSQTYLGSTFTSMNSLSTGSLTDVNAATKTFGADLLRLGQLIDFQNLDNLGSPFALIKQLTNIAGITPSLNTALVQVGLTAEFIDKLGSPTTTISDSVDKQLYQAMTTITGTALSEILTMFGVVTPGITTMADLLNPKKIFPNSYRSLTVKTFAVLSGPGSNPANTSVLRGIYTASGAVNQNLVQYLPKYVLSVAG
jgi:hypothetical protein